MKEKLTGSVRDPEAIYGKSAYEIAVMHGFEGTEEEWLADIVNRAAGIAASIAAEALAKSEAFIEKITPLLRGGIRIGEITLTAAGWSGEDNLYSQVVTPEGVTANSQVDLTPSAEQLAVFYEKDISFVTENDNGVVTVYVIGQKPQNDYTIQITITEVG
jgi:hypothetical protein